MITFNTIPLSVSSILKTLRDEGYESYLVGGCVRDILLGKKPHDYDITTNATPDQVEQLFSHTIPTGKQYGTIIVVWDSEDGMREQLVEVTTFRKDSPTYSDGRRPDYVEFGTSLKEDVERRDFTINALAWSPETGVLDYVNGLQDLNKGIVRCVGVAEQRFKEDALRTVRAIRFALKYNFIIDELPITGTLHSLYEAITEDNCLEHISKERIHDEIIKMIPYLSTNEEIKILKNPMIINCLNIIFDMKDIFADNHILPPKEYSTLSEKLYHIYQYTPEKMKEQRFSNAYIKYVNDVNKCNELYFDYMLNKDEFKHNLAYMVRYLLSKYPLDVVEFVLTKVQGTFKAENLISPTLYKQLETDALTYCLSVKDLDIDGYDLMKLGYKDKEIGDILNKCLEHVLISPEENNKDSLLNFISTLNCIIK